MTQADPTPSPPPSGGSPLKWIALGCGGCLGLTVLAVVGLAVWVSRSVQFGVGPEQVEADNQELFTYALPGESRGIFNMGVLGMRVIQVASTDSPPSVLLTMGQLPSYLQGRDAQETFVEQFQESLAVEGNYQLAEQRVEERSLCGQPVSVLVQSGRFEEGATTYDAASLLTFVEHDNSARFVWLLAHGDTPEATADQVFASLDCP
ncbi:MAG TPA: hypothetical protein VLS96_04705 [Nodosilinea sp.]|nr:hypothetical protein [Nodosilinea sp.]